ncbi:MAG: hypothetical protein ACXQS8_08480 [Candidatus Helarchaeales archaeon]
MLAHEKLVDGVFLVKTDKSFPLTCQGILINVDNSCNVINSHQNVGKSWTIKELRVAWMIFRLIKEASCVFAHVIW